MRRTATHALLMAVLCAVCAAAAAAAAAPAPSDMRGSGFGPNYEADAAQLGKAAAESCASMEGSLFNPLRCPSYYTEPLGAAGRAFVASRAGGRVEALDLDPVVMLPGLGGSGLEAELHKPSAPHWYCTKNIDWFRTWLHLEELAVQDCWFDNLRLIYDAANDSYTLPPGVNIRAIDFGGSKGIDYLDYQFGVGVGLTGYYAEMIKSFTEVGYVVGKSLRGAPYDWRFDPMQLERRGLFSALQTLIEDTFNMNAGKRVHIITHSQGSPTALAFLNSMDANWKAKYINTFIPIAGPWAGATKSLRAVLTGDNFGLHIGDFDLVSMPKLSHAVRAMPGVIYLAPIEEVWGDYNIVMTPTRNYTASDLAALFANVDATAAAIYSHVRNEIWVLEPPGVHTYCLYGTGVPTEVAVRYDNDKFDKQPVELLQNSLGDGTVPLESLQQCVRWGEQQEQPVVVNEFHLLDHTGILKDAGLIHYILDRTTHASA